MDPLGTSTASATASIKTTESKRFKVKGVGVTKTFQSLLAIIETRKNWVELMSAKTSETVT